MPRQIVNDVIPPGARRSVRNIPVPPRNYRWSGNDDEEQEEERVQENKFYRRSSGKGKKRARWVLWSIVVIVLAVMGVAIGKVTSGATVTITLKSAPAKIELTGTAVTATTTSEIYLPYEPIVVSGSEGASLDPEGTKRMERKASGTITVYNNFSSATQRLIKNTRFETPEGKIYRIPESIIVPGKKIENGKTVPGSVETVVYADNSGPEYNGELFNFTIPGFKNSPERYAGFYAKSKTSMTGGFSGTAPFVSPEKASLARVALRSELEKKLFNEAKSKVSANEVLFSGGFYLKTTSEPDGESPDKKVYLEEKGVMTAFAFPKKELFEFLARKSLMNYDGAPISFNNIENLSFEFLNKLNFGKGNDTKVGFSLKGTGTVVWTLDEGALIRALAGKEKSEIAGILSSYAAIKSSKILIRPFWKSVFPENTSKIKIVTAPETVQ